MRAARIASLVLVAAAIGLGLGPVSYAFHSGGVGECGGCHNMHGAVSASRLLVGTDPSSACLTCHEHEGDTGPSSYHISTAAADMGPGVAPLQRTPGGDFGWLKKTYTWTVPWGTFGEAGQTHGHNIIALDFGYVEDSENSVAPGGTVFNSVDLSCTSCHDPHAKLRRTSADNAGPTYAYTGAPIIGSGSYQTSLNPTPGSTAVGTYRLLAADGYGAFDIGSDPPAAIAPNTVFGPGADPGYNQSEATNQVRVAYGTGFADWCTACHTDMNGFGDHHPTDWPLGAGAGNLFTLDNYNAYRGSGNATGDDTDSYLTLVPLQEGDDDFSVLKGLAAGNSPTYAGPGPTGTGYAEVSCMTCHRAHASGFEYALRWNPESEFLVENGQWPGTDNGASPQFARGRTEAEMQAAYYDRDWSVFGGSTYQRSLCNKCHAQD